VFFSKKRKTNSNPCNSHTHTHTHSYKCCYNPKSQPAAAAHSFFLQSCTSYPYRILILLNHSTPSSVPPSANIKLHIGLPTSFNIRIIRKVFKIVPSASFLSVSVNVTLDTCSTLTWNSNDWSEFAIVISFSLLLGEMEDLNVGVSVVVVSSIAPFPITFFMERFFVYGFAKVCIVVCRWTTDIYISVKSDTQ